MAIMVFAPIPRIAGNLTIQVDDREHVIELRGVLSGEPQMIICLDDALGYAARCSASVWSIRNLNLAPMIEGVTAWIRGIEKHLSKAGLIYEPGQLELTLRYNREYKHSRSAFPPEGT